MPFQKIDLGKSQRFARTAVTGNDMDDEIVPGSHGGENRSSIREFYGAGREDDSRAAAFEFTNGEPPVLLGNNEGANPVEFLLHALAGCVTTTLVLHAMARGIVINELSSELEGDSTCMGRSASTTPSRRATIRSASACM